MYICTEGCTHICTRFARYSNVKTVKEQTFHKRSANVPTSNRNESKTSEFVPQSAPSKEIIGRFDPNRFWTKSKQSVLNKTNSGTIPKRFGFVPKTITEHCLILGTKICVKIFFLNFSNDCMLSVHSSASNEYPCKSLVRYVNNI